ncbi:pyrroline-5-carboxylate reductase [Evansella sp. AB-P1]|uniref:pyrroline-5-carboxylate reductase n=1 Tax=Evansella sp. AB-P1 TaxID=3037653 RepID=UPI00241F1174|nr:pyrroline-5-carboxylate reductase [Evansella sp. AB-P1]MDG5787751.1 pyrroline-5-carboxylate reductase [Evansella sp. AB-P1]
MKKVSILMVGAGRMAEAIIAGLVKDRRSIDRLTVTNLQNKEKLINIKNTYKVETSSKWEEEIHRHDVIILATPPQTQEEQLESIHSVYNNQLVITVAAGIDPTYMEKRLPENAAVCWIMPNTAAQVGKSMSTYVCGKNVSTEQREIITFILSAIGNSEELTEQQVHDLTAITGSAPAFVYSFVEALEGAALEYGITLEQSRNLVSNMLKGSAAMLEEGYEPSELIAQVASPGGSTAEGLKVFHEKGFKEIVHEAVKATNEHARGHGK